MGFQEDFQAYKEQRQHQVGVKESAPGQFSEGEFSEFKRRQQQSQQESSQRFPILGTAVGTGVGLATFYYTKSAALSGLAATIASVPADMVQTLLEKGQITPEDIASSGKEGAFQGLGEGVGQAPFQVLKRFKFFNLFRDSVTPEAREAIQFLAPRTGTERPPIMPAQATENRALDLMHNIAEHSIIGGGVIRAQKVANESQHSYLAEQFLNDIGPTISADDAARLFVSSAQDNFRIKTYPAKMFYNTIQSDIAPRTKMIDAIVQEPTGLLDQAGNPLMKDVVKKVKTLEGGIRANFKGIKAFATSKNDIQERLQGIGSDVVGGSLLERIVKMPNKPYTSDLIELRKVLRATRTQLEASLETKKNPAIGNIKTLESMVDESIEISFLQNRMPDHLNLWRAANTIYRDGSKQFNNKVIRQMAQKADLDNRAIPEDVITTAFQSGKTARMRVMKQAVSPEAWNKISRVGMTRIYEKSIQDGMLIGKTLEKNLIGPTGLGGQGLVEAVGSVNAQNWLKLANAIKVRQAKQAASEGSVFIQLTQAGALLTGVSNLFTDVPAEANIMAGGILLGPAAISKIMTHPSSARALIDGISKATVEKATALAGLTTRILQALIPRQVSREPKTPQAFKNRQSQALVEDSTKHSLYAIGAR